MQTITYYLNRLKLLKERLKAFLILKNLSVYDSENFNTMIPKLETLTSKETGTVNLTYYSFYKSPLSNTEIHELIKQLPYVVWGDVMHTSTGDAYNLSDLFYGASGLTKLNIVEDLHINKVYSFDNMLYGTNVTHLSLANLDSSKFINATGIVMSKLIELDLTNSKLPGDITFSGCSNLENIIGLDTVIFKSNYTGYGSIYQNCAKLKHIDLTLIPFPATSSAKNYPSCCLGCTSLESLKAILPYYCSSIASFCQNCQSLTNLDLRLETDPTSTITVNISSLLYGCSSLINADLSNIKCTATTNMTSVARGCTQLESLNMPNIIIPDAVDMTNFITDCANLKTVTFNKSVIKPSKISYIFKGCNNIEELISSMHFNEWDLSGLSGYQYEVISNPNVVYWDPNYTLSIFRTPLNLKEITYLNFSNAKDKSTGYLTWVADNIKGFLINTLNISNTHYQGNGGPVTYVAVSSDDTTTTHSSRGLVKNLIYNNAVYEVTYSQYGLDDKLFNKQVYLESVEANNLQIKLHSKTNIRGGLYGCVNLKNIDMSTWTISWVDDTVQAPMNFDYFFGYSGLETFKWFNSPVKIESFVSSLAHCINLHTADLTNFDFSECNKARYGFIDMPALQTLIFGTNYGKGFTLKRNNYDQYTLDLHESLLLTYESLMDVINKLYDLNITYGVYYEEGNPGTGTLYTQQLILGETNLAKLTPEEIAIATNKGWTVS